MTSLSEIRVYVMMSGYVLHCWLVTCKHRAFLSPTDDSQTDLHVVPRVLFTSRTTMAQHTQ